MTMYQFALQKPVVYLRENEDHTQWRKHMCSSGGETHNSCTDTIIQTLIRPQQDAVEFSILPFIINVDKKLIAHN